MEENLICTGLKIFNRPDKEICPIEEAPLKERTKRLLINTRGLKDISELRQYTKWQILSWRGVGDMTLNDIMFCMRSYDLMFKDDYGAYPMNVIADLFPNKSFCYKDGLFFRYQQMLRYHLDVEEQLAIEKIFKLGEYYKTDDPIWERLRSGMTKLGLPHILNYILYGEIEPEDTFPDSIVTYRPTLRPCSLCKHHYRRRGKHRKYAKDIFCDLTNEYVGPCSAEELGCEHFENKYNKENNNTVKGGIHYE